MEADGEKWTKELGSSEVGVGRMLGAVGALDMDKLQEALTSSFHMIDSLTLQIEGVQHTKANTPSGERQTCDYLAFARYI